VKQHDPLQQLLALDRVIHEPARLAILTILMDAEEVEFKFLEIATGLTKGNLSSHAAKLEAAGYLEMQKSFRGKLPLTTYRLSAKGRAALDEYWARVRAALPEVAVKKAKAK
jgi:DNA-binding transcriptional ArsR family regulator